MENSYTAFVQNLHKFVSDLNRYVPNKGSQDFLKVFNKLDMGKVILRYLSTMRDYEDKLQAKDESIFTLNLDVFPGIELDELWQQLSSGQKKKVWTYLQILYIQSELILDYENTQQSSDKQETLGNMISNVTEYQNEVSKNAENDETSVKSNDDTDVTDVVDANTGDELTTLQFDPFVGVGNANEEYSTNDMFAGIENLPDEKMTPGLSSLANLVGIDKMIPNLDELKNQLKNMDKKDIDDATNNIKSLLGDNVNDQTSDLISDMLTNITDELKKEDMEQGDPLQNIFKIAETVATRMKPKVENSNVDMQELLNSTQNIASNCKDSEGKP
jgi:flagellar hook-basal body complex protein FliE